MKKLISLFVILTVFSNTFSQTIEQDTVIAREYLLKADKFKENLQFDSSLENIKKAEKIYLGYNLKKDFFECEIKKADLFLSKKDLNKALEILSSGKQKVLNTFGRNSALYADFCEKTGLVYLYAKKYADAKNMWVNALVTRRKIYGEEHLKIADSYNNLGFLYTETGEDYRSLKLYEKALQIRKKQLPANDMKIASSQTNVGKAYLKIGNPDLALDYFLKSSEIKKKKLNRFSPELASAYLNLADVYKITGDYDKSLKNYENALLIKSHNLGENNPETAGIYAKAALILNLKGDYDKSLTYSKNALGIFEKKYGEKHSVVAKILQNIASVYLNEEDITKAVEYFNKSLEISKKLYDTWNLKTAEKYTEAGLILSEKSKNTAALNYFSNALKIQRTVFDENDNHLEIAETFIHIADAYKADGDYYPALENYDKSLAIKTKILGNKHPETAHIYYLKALVYKAKKTFPAELNFLQKALIGYIENFNSQDINSNPVFNNSTDYYFDMKAVSEILTEKADAFTNIYYRTNNPDKLKQACKVYESADKLFSVMKTFTSGEKYRSDLKEKMTFVYEKAAETCMLLYKKTKENEYFNKAFMFAEKNKLSALSYFPAAGKFSDIPDSVSEKQINLNADIAYFRKKISKNPNDAKTKNKMLALLREHRSFMNILQTDYQKYYELKYPTFSLTVRDIQNFIDDSTFISDYFSPKQSKVIYIFSIQKNKTNINFIKKSDDFKIRILNFRKQFYANSGNFAEEGYALYKELLPNISENDTAIKHLVIIPDGISGIIPFEALLTEPYSGNPDNFENYPYLIKKYAVSYAYSANFFREEDYSDTLEYSDTTDISGWLGVAPSFDVVNAGGISTKTKENLKKAEQSFQTGTHTHLLNNYLPESENELLSIYNLFITEEEPALMKTASDADELFIKSAEPGNYEYLHFASPAFINSEEPDISGILFAENNRTENDGILYTDEMFNLKLNSDLLVLSACETGVKKYERGEGIRALTNALFYGGTKDILLSLWQVSDKSTGKLMLYFYTDILTEYADIDELTYSLRKAKLKLINEKEYARPFFWSPFILIRN